MFDGYLPRHDDDEQLDAAAAAALDETRALLHQVQHRVIGDHAKQPYPHGHGCQGCFEAKRCAVCGTSIDVTFEGGLPHCTNGRCMQCHTKHCTGGGVSGPGHGYGPALT